MASAIDPRLHKELEELRGEPIEIIDPDAIPCTEISDKSALPENPLVSVKMITYNHEPYIAEAIEGVLLQKTSFPIELVIGEDCSTDRTRDIVMHYQKKFPGLIRVITSERNVGATKNSLRTERACRGKYIAYCEGDDYWCDMRKLQRQAAILEQYPNVGLVYCEGRTVNGKEEVLKERSSLRKPGLEKRGKRLPEMFHRVGILTCSVLLRREVIMNAYGTNPLFLAKLYVGDVLRWMEVLANYDSYFIDEVMVTYHKHASSAMRTFPLEVARDVYFILSYFALKHHDCQLEQRKIVDALWYQRLQTIEKIPSVLVRWRAAWHLLKSSVRRDHLQHPRFYCALLFATLGLYEEARRIRKRWHRPRGRNVSYSG